MVLNLVTPEHVARVRARIDEEAAAAGRPGRARLAVWIPAALDPGGEAHAQLAGQLAVYLGAPGYGEMFAALGFGSLVDLVRGGGTRRAELVAAIPSELLEQVGAIGSARDVRERIRAYRDAGADHVGVAPSTAEDPAGRRLLGALARDIVAER